MKAALLLVAAALAGPALAQQQPQLRASASVEHSSLTRGHADWQQETLTLARALGNRDVQQVSLSHYRRFGLDDNEMTGYVSSSLSPAVTGWLQGTYSPSHRVIAKSSVAGGLQYEFSKGWLAHGSLHHASYTSNGVDRASLGLERYFGDFGVLVAGQRARALGRSTGAWDVRGSWYYAGESSVTLALASGDEVTQLGAGALAIADVRSVALYGRHRLNERWSLTWGAQRVRQGDFYTRTGGSGGAQYLF